MRISTGIPQAVMVPRIKVQTPSTQVRFGEVDEEGNWKNKRFDELMEKCGDKLKGGLALAGGAYAMVNMPTVITVITAGWAPALVGLPLIGYGAYKLGIPQYALKKGGQFLARKLVGDMNPFKSKEK